ncbi:MAG TPA: serine hydrolase [Phenylobacterium sp.]|nr:serine hydrolase [Phenylobacterium sp.]
MGLQAAVDYAQSQRTTGLLIVQGGKILAEHNWPAPAGDGPFRAFAYERTPDGALLEDVASQQKSFVAMLAAIAVDRGLIDVEAPVSEYVGAGWSKAASRQEQAIRIVHLLNMNSGLDDKLAHAAPAGTVFHYNTPAYAVIKQVLAAAAKQTLETITSDWLTAPAGMGETAWRRRPAAFADVGNPTGLVTSPRDVARFGQIVLDRGRAPDGQRVVSEAQLDAMFARSPTNPAYGRLWWLNGGAHGVRPMGQRFEGPLTPAAPADMVAALGHLDRKLYVAPSLRLVVVRMGDAAADRDFDQQLWRRLSPALA